MDEYRETILKAIREYEKQFDPVEQYEITDAIGVLYEIVRAINENFRCRICPHRDKCKHEREQNGSA